MIIQTDPELKPLASKPIRMGQAGVKVWSNISAELLSHDVDRDLRVNNGDSENHRNVHAHIMSQIQNNRNQSSLTIDSLITSKFKHNVNNLSTIQDPKGGAGHAENKHSKSMENSHKALLDENHNYSNQPSDPQTKTDEVHDINVSSNDDDGVITEATERTGCRTPVDGLQMHVKLSKNAMHNVVCSAAHVINSSNTKAQPSLTKEGTQALDRDLNAGNGHKALEKVHAHTSEIQNDIFVSDQINVSVKSSIESPNFLQLIQRSIDDHGSTLIQGLPQVEFKVSGGDKSDINIRIAMVDKSKVHITLSTDTGSIANISGENVNSLVSILKQNGLDLVQVDVNDRHFMPQSYVAMKRVNAKARIMNAVDEIGNNRLGLSAYA